MAVMTPVTIQTIRATPTELAFSITPLGLTKIPEPMMLPASRLQAACSLALSQALPDPAGLSVLPSGGNVHHEKIRRVT
ncbi:hypothetical protein EYF80_017777 [Liparis tanakae]|uniref:Uncharacterized protein n=1 Tax=Liparis tanakae TaxID=230148 RepID=A0A4Z2I1N8_9TELE|nr:hypothetical protein EYF80_017777 [Liparis tanakae]